MTESTTMCSVKSTFRDPVRDVSPEEILGGGNCTKPENFFENVQNVFLTLKHGFDRFIIAPTI